MAEDKYVRLAKKYAITISPPPTPNQDPTTSSEITNSPVTQREKIDTAQAAKSYHSRPTTSRAERHAYATSQRSFSDNSVELFQNGAFLDERTIEVQREIQRVRDEGERQKQEYEFNMAQRSETQSIHPTYGRWVERGHNHTGIPTRTLSALDMRLLNEEYDKQYPFSLIREDEENTSVIEYQQEGGEIEHAPAYTDTTDTPNESSSLYDATSDQARTANPAPGKLDPKALAFKPSLELQTTGTSNQVNEQKSTPAEAGKLDPAALAFKPSSLELETTCAPSQVNEQKSKSAEAGKLDPAAQAFNPAPKVESTRHVKCLDNNDSTVTGVDRLDPEALSFRPSSRPKTPGPARSYHSHESENPPSEVPEEAMMSKKNVVRKVKKAMGRQIGNPERVDWNGKAVLISIKGHVYSAHLTYLGLSDAVMGHGSQDLDV